MSKQCFGVAVLYTTACKVFRKSTLKEKRPEGTYVISPDNLTGAHKLPKNFSGHEHEVVDAGLTTETQAIAKHQQKIL